MMEGRSDDGRASPPERAVVTGADASGGFLGASGAALRVDWLEFGFGARPVEGSGEVRSGVPGFEPYVESRGLKSCVELTVLARCCT